MTRISALAFVAATFATAVHAQSADPQVPNPANPFPRNAVATDGSHLPRSYLLGAGSYGRDLPSGRSGFIDDAAVTKRR